MSFLSGALLPVESSLHDDLPRKKHVTISEKSLRKPQSTASLVAPLVRLVKDPAGSIEELLESFWVGQTLEPLPTSPENDVETRKLLLQHRLQTADDYVSWRAAALELDTIDGNDAWKASPESPHYNHRLVQDRLDELNRARTSGDPKRMLHLLRTSLSRELGNMGDLKLYKHSRIGTKRLIDEYISAACETMTTLLEQLGREDCELDRRDAHRQVLQARQSFGRSALLLSGGGTFGMTHIGVVKSLFESNLLPRVICGSSAGSIICSVLCARTDDELPDTLEGMCHGDLDVFEKQGEQDSLLQKAARLAKVGSLFDIQHLTRVMKGLLGDLTFQEAYNRTGRVLNISVSSAGIHELPRLLNYVTAPNVIIWSAVAASCSVPLVFTPAAILAKDRLTGDISPWNPVGQLWIDGSVDNDLPMTRLAEIFNINHFIVSQVNPHVVPFLIGDESVSPYTSSSMDPATAVGSSWLNTLASFAKSEALHRMHVLTELGVFPNYLTKIRSVLSQRYAGDITILPEISYAQFPRILRNPSPEFMKTSMRAGERATWLHLDRIRNHCAIELALDKLTLASKEQIAFSSSQVDLRLKGMSPSQHSLSKSDSKRPRPRHKTKSWCAEPGQRFDSALHMTPAKPKANRSSIETEWTAAAEAEITAHEDASDSDDEDDGEYLSFGSSRKTSRWRQHLSRPNSPPSEPSASPGAISPLSTFGRLSPRKLFSHSSSRSNPGTPKTHFQSLSGLTSLAAHPSNAGVRWALSPAEERDGLNLTLTNSMQAEVPATALGVDSQAERTAATPLLDGASRTSGPPTASSSLDLRGLRSLLKKKTTSA